MGVYKIQGALFEIAFSDSADRKYTGYIVAATWERAAVVAQTYCDVRGTVLREIKIVVYHDQVIDLWCNSLVLTDSELS